MLVDAAKRIAKIAKEGKNLPLGKPDFQPKDKYKSHEFNLNNFKKLDRFSQDSALRQVEETSKQSLDSHVRDLKIAAMDGGNLEVLSTPSFSVSFERIFFNCFKDNERINLDIPSKIEFFVVATSSENNNKINYTTEFVPLNSGHEKYLPDPNDLVFDSHDETIQTGLERISISRVADVARSFAEWHFAKFVIGQLKEGDIFVRDGTLQTPYTNQAKYADSLYSEAKKRGALICGVAKTSQLYTTSGLPLISAVARLEKENQIQAPWYYENIVDITDSNHNADLNFAKLNSVSDYIFRVEILKGQEENKEQIMAALAHNSTDLSFPGYPYALLDADKQARVSYDELDALRMLILSEISKTGDFDTFKQALKSSDAHDWLNNVV